MKNNIIKNIFLLATLMLVVSCGGLKSSGSKGASASSSNLFETFFVGDAGTQYFVKPIVFVNDDKEEIFVDFTFRYKNETSGMVDCKFSVVGPKVLKNIDNVVFSNGETNADFENISLLYNEVNKDLFISRFSSSAKLVDLKNLFNNNDWKIKVDNLKEFVPKSATRKYIDKLQQSIFVLM